jgi:16S rRNA (uracil1498-N3)-methyltransferase
MSTPPLFFADAEKLRVTTVGEMFLLDGNEGHHAAAVRRLRVGERLEVSDGAGLLCAAEVAAVAAHAIEARIVARREVPPPAPRLTVVQALAKGDRDERAVETLTEVGVDAIVPWQAARSIVRWSGARGGKSAARWRATAREAAKQSRRPWLPDVADAVDTLGVVTRLAAPSVVGVVLHEHAERPLTQLAVPLDGEIVLIVGPEGGITDEERDAFQKAGATVYGLGPTVLRTSTAGTVAAAVLLAGAGRWDISAAFGRP